MQLKKINSVREATQLLLSQTHYDFFALMVIDIYGAIRSVSLPASYLSEKVLTDGIGFDASNFGYADIHQSDMVAVPDLSTAFIETTDTHTTVHAFCNVQTTDARPFDQYPRSVARAALQALKQSGVGDDAQMLLELEFFVFDKVAYSAQPDYAFYQIGCREGLGEGYNTLPRFGVAKGYHQFGPNDRYKELRNRVVQLLNSLSIPVKYHHHEVAASQLEIELDFISLVQAADAVALAKWVITGVADEMGLYATFMPKPLFRAAGSGMHVHQFITKNGQSVFPGNGTCGLSPIALHYTAGLLSHALTGALLAWSNPSTNSFKRLVPGYEAPVTASFAHGSRAAAVRIPGYLKPGEARLEFRTGDATANPYYFLAAMLLAGLDGIRKQWDPVQMGYAKTRPSSKNTFPTHLTTVMNGLLKDNAFLAPAFPPNLIETWARLKKAEAQQVYTAPTPQEFELYF